MAVEGIQSYAKCLGCGDVLYCETSSAHQSVYCPCNGTHCEDGVTEGAVDPNFGDEEMEAWLLLHTPQT